MFKGLIVAHGNGGVFFFACSFLHFFKTGKMLIPPSEDEDDLSGTRETPVLRSAELQSLLNLLCFCHAARRFVFRPG